MLTTLRRLAVLPVLLCSLAALPSGGAYAQCLGPDNLDVGPCCSPVLPNLPAFPNGSLPGLGICWGQCTVTNTRTLKVTWGTPTLVTCGEYSAPLTVFDGGSGAPLLGGNLVLDYTRTWSEVTTAGTAQQVWRFTAKADLSALTPPGTPPCPVPNCIAPFGPHPTAFFYGYMDYTSCAAAGPWEQALVLYHAADRFIHAPGLSDKPGAFHPSSSYAIVAPHSALQPFVPQNNIAAGGNVVGEATRNVNSLAPLPNPCTVEDAVLNGSMTPLGAGCLSTLATNPKQQTLRQFQGVTTCVNTAGLNGGWATLNINFPTIPWFHMVTSSIGRWSNPNIYPSTELAWVDEGLFVTQDACTGNFVELKYGGSTKGGWPKILASVPGGPVNFTDLADNYTAPLLGPYPTPILGSIRQTDHLLYVNEP